MPNWCSTTIRFECDDVNVINEFKSKIEEYTSKEFSKSDFGNSWLGNIVKGFGIENENIVYRGSVVDIGYDENEPNVLLMYTETAWIPMIKMFIIINEKFYNKKMKIYWIAEECGCELYCTNNREIWSEDYCKIDYCLKGNWGNDYFDNEETALKTINKLLSDNEYDEIKDLKSDCINFDDENFITISILDEVSDDYFD